MRILSAAVFAAAALVFLAESAQAKAGSGAAQTQPAVESGCAAHGLAQSPWKFQA